ncbi:hypothetical protein ES708_19140 [subsurface metagenome]
MSILREACPKPINPTTYEVELAGGDKVEIGEREAVDFKPHLKLNRWGGECFIKVGLPTTEKISPVVEEGKIKWCGQKIDTRFYPLEPRTVIAKDKHGRDVSFTQNGLGGFEFEIALKEKPTTNQIVFDIEAQELRFSYQPPLHPDHPTWNEEASCPENVVGSYAVYHATKKNNKYMTGKAFHIYRPIAEDALGNKAWCSLHIDGYIDPKSLTITLPQQFMDEAIYPVTIDPDFGRTTIGETWYSIAEGPGKADREYRRGAAWTMPAPGGTANWIKAYLYGDFGEDPCDCKVFINQKDSGGAGTHGQIATKENLGCALAADWEQFNLASEALTAAVVYILNIIGDMDSIYYNCRYRVAGDANGAVASYMEGEADYDAPASPWVENPEGTTIDYSIYCNYSPPVVSVASAATGITSASAILNGILSEDMGDVWQGRFQWGKTEDYGNNTDWQPDPAALTTGDTFSQLIAALEPGTLYHFRAQAQDSLGIFGIVSGPDIAFWTLKPSVGKAYAFSRELHIKRATVAVDKASIAASGITTLADCKGINLVEVPSSLTLTVEATYDGSATQGIKIHVRTSLTDQALGTHTGADGAAALTDAAAHFVDDELIGLTIKNLTDGSSGAITANTGTGVTATLVGGTNNDWDGDDVYIIEGAGYDTEDWDSFTPAFGVGSSIRQTEHYDVDPVFLKVLVENLDPAEAVTDVKITMAVGT